MGLKEKTVFASLEAKGSPEELKNTVNLQAMIYANCGRWQKGNTDFLLVSESEVVLASWGNFNGEVSHSSTDGFLSKYNRDDQIRRLKSQSLKKFFRGQSKSKRAWPLEILSLYIPALKKENQFKLTDDDKLLVIIPDCHITLFKGWAWDEFVMPFEKESRRISLEKEFGLFHQYAKDQNAEIVQLGDLLDNWHVQWMYEQAFDIYHALRSNQSFSELTKRFPIELLSNPNKWPLSTDQNSTVYSWWRHLPTYLGVSENEVRTNWNKKVCPCDVLAILFWGLDLDSWATCLSDREFDVVRKVLDISLGNSVPSWHKGVCPGQSDKNSDFASFWKYVRILKASVGKNEPLDFLTNDKIETRISESYSIKPILDTLRKEKSNFLRGNHDCAEENKYLKDKFSREVEDSQLKQLYKKKGGKEFDHEDSKTQLDLPELTKICGKGGRVCIEHGDAWDVTNNGLHCFEFDKFIDGGYHTPKRAFWHSFNDQKLEDKWILKPVQWLFTKVGDVGLEPPANNRTNSIFLEKWGDMPQVIPFSDRASKVALVVMGHTHIRRLKLLSGLSGESFNHEIEESWYDL